MTRLFYAYRTGGNKKRGLPFSLPPFDALKASRLRSTLCSTEPFIHDLAQIASAIWIKH